MLEEHRGAAVLARLGQARDHEVFEPAGRQQDRQAVPDRSLVLEAVDLVHEVEGVADVPDLAFTRPHERILLRIGTDPLACPVV